MVHLVQSLRYINQSCVQLLYLNGLLFCSLVLRDLLMMVHDSSFSFNSCILALAFANPFNL